MKYDEFGYNTRPIGSVFKIDGKKYIVKEGKCCAVCPFELGKPLDIHCYQKNKVIGECGKYCRTDGKDVYFEEL